ncbi:MAG: hypothetical protein WCH39_00470 [Schlesneria sp.]
MPISKLQLMGLFAISQQTPEYIAALNPVEFCGLQGWIQKFKDDKSSAMVALIEQEFEIGWDGKDKLSPHLIAAMKADAAIDQGMTMATIELAKVEEARKIIANHRGGASIQKDKLAEARKTMMEFGKALVVLPK